MIGCVVCVHHAWGLLHVNCEILMARVARMSVPRAVGVAGGLPQRKVSQRLMARRPAPVRVVRAPACTAGHVGNAPPGVAVCIPAASADTRILSLSVLGRV
jgi:hypothetical protein